MNWVSVQNTNLCLNQLAPEKQDAIGQLCIKQIQQEAGSRQYNENVICPCVVLTYFVSHDTFQRFLQMRFDLTRCLTVKGWNKEQNEAAYKRLSIAVNMHRNFIVGITDTCDVNIMSLSLTYDHYISMIYADDHYYMIDAYTDTDEKNSKELTVIPVDGFKIVQTIIDFVKLPNKWSEKHIDAFRNLTSIDRKLFHGAIFEPALSVFIT